MTKKIYLETFEMCPWSLRFSLLLFNSFFAKQCVHIETGSNLATQLLCRTNESLNTINFTEDDILSVIGKLDPNRAHGNDQISIRMIQICDKSIYKSLHLIFCS